MDDYLALESPLIDRLKDQVDLVPENNVQLLADLAGVTEKQQRAPALHVIYAGDQIPGGDAGIDEYADAQLITQRWLVVVGVRHAKGGEKAHANAGKIMTQVLRALSGQTLLAGTTSLRRVNASVPPRYVGTMAYFPLMFATNLLTE